jgi:hypothetical protein
MQFTSEDLKPLKAALISGTTSVRIGDRTVSFRSIAELKSLIKEIEEAIEAEETQEVPKSAKNIQASWSKK